MSRFQTDFTTVCSGMEGNRESRERTLRVVQSLVSGSLPDLGGFTPEMLARAGYLMLFAATLVRLEKGGNDDALQKKLAGVRKQASGNNAPFYLGEQPDHCGAAASFGLSSGAELASLLRMFRMHELA